MQADGKIVVAGTSFHLFGNEFSVVRYNTDGSLDTSFDGDGKVTTKISTSFSPVDVGKAVALQPDGKIIVAGDSRDDIGNHFALARYNQDGSLDTLDTSFNGTGKVTTPIIGGAGLYRSSAQVLS